MSGAEVAFDRGYDGPPSFLEELALKLELLAASANDEPVGTTIGRALRELEAERPKRKRLAAEHLARMEARLAAARAIVDRSHLARTMLGGLCLVETGVTESVADLEADPEEKWEPFREVRGALDRVESMLDGMLQRAHKADRRIAGLDRRPHGHRHSRDWDPLPLGDWSIGSNGYNSHYAPSLSSPLD